MKKSIATIALFTLALVTTSFTTVETPKSLANNTVNIDPPGTGTGGQCSMCGTKKLDITQEHISSDTTKKADKVVSFSTDTQSSGNSKKLD